LNVEKKPKTYFQRDNVIWFEPGIEIGDDVLIRCRHYRSKEERLSVFRLLLHPGFANDQVLRYQKKDIDFSPEVEVSDNFFIDFTLVPTENNNPDVSTIMKLKDEC